MITFIQGQIVQLSPTQLVLEAAGIGYMLHISLHTYSAIEGKSGQLKILTYLQIKEDAHTLYGFASEEERQIFLHLISVNGVGTGIARIILSSMAPEEIRKAIIHEQEAAFGRVKGIGPKTAKRIIIDLKDKIMKSDPGSGTESTAAVTGVREEAAAALLSLGFSRIAVDKTLQQIARSSSAEQVEDWIKQALKLLSS